MAHGERASVAGGRMRGGLLTCFSGGGTMESSRNGYFRSSSSSLSKPSTRSSSGCSHGRVNSATETAEVVAEEEVENGRRRRRKYRKVLAKMVRSVAFVSYLDQSGRGQEIRKKLLDIHLPDSSSEKSSAPSTSRSTDDDDRTIEPIFFSSSSSSSSSSMSSSSSLSSDLETRQPITTTPRSRRKPKPATARVKITSVPPRCPRNHVPATAVLLSVMALFMIVFCGKFLAIIWTCTCFYFAPCRSTAVAPAVVRQCVATDEKDPSIDPRKFRK